VKLRRTTLSALCAFAVVGVFALSSLLLRMSSLDAEITVDVSNSRTNYSLSLRNRSFQKVTIWLEEQIQTKDNTWKKPSGASVLFQSANSRYLEVGARSQTNLSVAPAYYGKKWRVVVRHQSNGQLSTYFRRVLRNINLGNLTIPATQHTDEYPSIR
jgi:hypothetical protein